MARPFDDHFKDKLSNYEEQPSDLSWIAVSTHLEGQRAQNRQKRIIAFTTVATILFMAVGGFVGWKYFDATPARLLSVHHTNWHIPSMGSPAALSANVPTRHEPVVAGKGPAADDYPATASNVTGTAPPEADHSGSPVSHKVFLDKLSPQMPLLASNKEVILPDIKPFLLNNGSINEDAFEGLKIGLMAGLQNGILAGSVINRYMADRQISRELKVRPLFGLAARYDFSSAFGLEANLIISSGEGQKFVQHREKKDLSLNYIRIPVLASYHFTNVGKTGRHPKSITFQAGLQYGRLNWVNLDDFGNTLEPGNFNTNELGFAGGIAYDQYISGEYLITLGIRGSINNRVSAFPQVLTNESMINYHVGLYFQFNYSMQ